jgi:hypothetical protein
MLTTVTWRPISIGFFGVAAIVCAAAVHASEPEHRLKEAPSRSDHVMQSNHDPRTVIVVKSLTVPSLLQIENVSLEAASTRAPQPSTILKFDVFNDTPSRLTDVVMNVSFVEKQLPERFTTPARVLVGPVTIRVAEILQAGYTLRYEMLFRNLSSDCDCSPSVEILSARLLPD